jgi:hypothetical protein
MESARVTIAQSLGKVHAGALKSGLAFHDMRSEANLELTLAGAGDALGAMLRTPESGEITRIEDEPIAARPIPLSRRPSGFRYFLDGAQRTLPAYVVGTIPVVVAVASAGVLERDRNGQPRMMAGSTMLAARMIAPLRSENPDIDALIGIAQEEGVRVMDPLVGVIDSTDYHGALSDYGTMIARSYRAANEARAQVETEVFDYWNGNADEGWIAVDGAIKQTSPAAIGLVKSFTRQYLDGPEASTLFRLEEGTRTSAFQVQDKWREDKRTMWYQRFWNASGRDPRHALVRVEAAKALVESAAIDEIAAYLLQERRPRATADERWATLLYPIHYLEQILKRYLDSELRGWPSMR